MLPLSLDRPPILPYGGDAFQAESNHLDLFQFWDFHDFRKMIDFDLPVEEFFYSRISIKVPEYRLSFSSRDHGGADWRPLHTLTQNWN